MTIKEASSTCLNFLDSIIIISIPNTVAAAMYLICTLSTLVVLLLSLCIPTSLAEGCPFKSRGGDLEGNIDGVPCPRGKLRRRLSSLVNDQSTKERISDILLARVTSDASLSSAHHVGTHRSLQETSGCVTFSAYENLHVDIAALANAIADTRDRGHFLGGIVRLAAHDFMDFDVTAAGNQLGSDGCIDFLHPANAGLSDLWCDDSEACPLKALHDGPYAFMSRADFWVAAANAVIRTTSINNQVILPFHWGRNDRDPNAAGGSECAASSSRLPAESGCSEVEAVFLDRMGLSWRDAVALLGAHTLGRGDAAFSGHDGAWVDTDEETVIFDKRFYEEVMRRSWFPRTTTNPAGDEIQNWSWGGANRPDPVMMLNTDICLKFDIPEGAAPACCTDTTGNCRGNFDDVQCPTADQVRPEAVSAFDEFIGGDNLNNGNNDPFYGAFVTAWEQATENGHAGSLSPLVESCLPVEPTPNPTASPVEAPISSSPTNTRTTQPTPAPIPTSPSPTNTVTTAQPNADFFCNDAITGIIDKNGNTRDCAWVIAGDHCKGFGHLCPVSCDACLCRGGGMVCSTNIDCCSLKCRGDSTCEAPVWAPKCKDTM